MTRTQFSSTAALALLFLCIGLIFIPEGLEGAVEEKLQQAEKLEETELAAGQGGERTESSENRTEILVKPLPEPVDEQESDLANIEETEKYLTGTILDQDYEPLAEAWVIADVEAEPVLSDEEGNFQLPLRKPFGSDEGRRLKAWKEGMSIATKFVRQQEGILLVLKPDEGKEIQIVDSDNGLPLVGATATILVDLESERGDGFFDLRRYADVPISIEPSDGNGKIKIPDPKVSNNFTLEVTMEGYDRRIVNWWRLKRSEKVQLSRPKNTRMRFVRADGTPHAGARLCFPWESEVVTMDDDGWVDLPSSARWGFWSVQLLDDNAMWVFSEIEGDQISDGATLVTNHEARFGKLVVQGDEKPDQYEIASSAVWSGWGEQFLPDPTWNDEDLIWLPIDEKGAFKLETGWQSDKTFLHVRRVGSKGVLLSQKADGPGPHDLLLASASTLTAIVEVSQPEFLEGASLKIEGYKTEHEVTLPLTEGRLTARLPADKFSVSLVLADRPNHIPLGTVQMIGMDFEHTFYFEGLRNISGTVRADGKGVFPCLVRARSDEGFNASVDTNPQGQWEMKSAPEQNLWLSFHPEDGWLEPVDNNRQEMPRGVNELDFEIPVGYLLITPGDYPQEELEHLSVRRRYIPEDRVPGNHNYYRSARPDKPDLSNGPLEIAVAPSLITFNSGVQGLPMAETQITLRAGETRTFVVETLPTCVVSLWLEDSPYHIWGSWGMTPIDVPGLRNYPNYKLHSDSSEQSLGQISSRWHALPGRWKIWVRAPLWCWSENNSGQIGTGTLEFEMDVRSDWEEVWLRLGEQDKLEKVDD